MLHNWDVSVEEAIAIQERLRPLVQQSNSVSLDQVRTVAGIDASYGEVGQAAIVVFSFPKLEIIDQATATRESVFPYVPGLLSFREGPVVLDAMAKLKQQPDLLIFDGQGYAHPRRFGLACHLGLFLDRPSIGCAKTRFIGTYEQPGPNKGDCSPLLDQGETIGMVVRTRADTNPLFVSVGHKIDLPTAVEAVRRCVRGYRLPETTRAADHLAGIIAPDRERKGSS
ncbi:MAG TPA: deoxyribonuclease V [Ktedonobacterales bacterium]|nr:deoxyribonuclease V [Ktedonobacterales bacterium]